MAPYKAVTVSNFSSQASRRRYPNYHPLQQLAFILQPELEDFTQSQPPIIAEWRSNLVALSQRENLYFAAYRDKIHVTIPQGLKQIIPTVPELILILPYSFQSGSVGGCIDPGSPHCVNNILVGDLGSQEILLVACDDGDIIAYYVHAINNAIKMGASGDTVKAFFHENIGASAWGLAIHGPSRLIAASCNLRQITVFMPAYTSEVQDEAELDLHDDLYVEVPRLSQSPSNRKTNEKKTFVLGIEGHNIPTLSFADDPRGDEAQSILATDIAGNLWIFALYSEEFQRVPPIHHRGLQGNRSMGWGVLALPLKGFKRTDDLQQAIGGTCNLENTLRLNTVDGRVLKVFDIGLESCAVREAATQSMYSHRYASGISPLVLEDDSAEESGDDDDLGKMDEEMTRKLTDMLSGSEGRERHQLTKTEIPRLFSWDRRRPSNNYPGAPCPAPSNPGPQPRRFDDTDIANMVNMHPDDMAGVRSTKNLHAFLHKQFHDKPLGVRRKGQDNPEAIPFLDNQTAILRTYQYDIELLAPTLGVPRSVCSRVFGDDRTYEGLGMNNLIQGFERLNLIARIPPLSLVVIASQAGRAALITLTRPNDRFSINGPVASFRVDHLLPSQPELHRVQIPRRPLMGFAVSPLQTGGQTGENAKRWRLILHYYDHTILSYELSRDEQSDALMIL